MNNSSGTTYYEILEVAPDAPPHEIQRAYQRAKTTYSADNPALYTMFSAEEARELLKIIEEAYSVLANPSLRRAYDEALARGEPIPDNFASLYAASNAEEIVKAHQALPDFESTVTLKTTIQSQSAAKNLDPNTGRTSLSTYTIDEAFEQEIKNATEFDGSFLQRIRLYKNVSLDQMSEETKIGRHYLVAVETNDFKNLPAAVFVRGFIVQIARVLGLDEQKVASSYMKLFRSGGGK